MLAALPVMVQSAQVLLAWMLHRFQVSFSVLLPFVRTTGV